MRLKRVISAALAVSMAVSMMPATAVSAFAEGTSTNTAVTTTTVDENAPTSGDCGVEGHEKEVKWAFNKETGVLTISGAGDMRDYTNDDPAPWMSFADKITEIKIGDQVTGIGTIAFAGLKKLTKVNIPASITRLGSYIFNNDEELVTVDWAPDFRAPSVQDTDLLKYNADHLTHEGTFVPTGMFDHCYKLGEGQELSAWLGGRFTGICCAAFRGTKFTVDFDQLNNMEYWGPYAFASMENLDSVTLTEGPTIGKLGGLARTFAGSGLKKMVVNAKVVPAWIAENCEKLETVEFGNEVTTIETYAFCNTGITELNVPETANGLTIDRAAFINNKNLKNVTLHGNVTLKGAAFTGCGIENFTVAEGANVLGTANPFSEWANKTETIASAVTSVKNVTIMGTLEADPTSVSGNVTPEQQTTGLWGQMFHEQTGIDEITVNGANLQYIQGNTFPNLRKMYVVGGDAVPVGYTYSGKPLESVDIDVSTYTSSHHGAFFDAQQLKTVTIKANSVTLGQNDFQLCPELKAVDLSQCGSVTYNNNTFGMGEHNDYPNSASTNKDVYIYVKDNKANPRNSSTDTGIGGNGIVMVVKGGTVNTDKTGFDSVTKAGCTAKWYEDANCQIETKDTTPVTVKTYYAKWACTVSFDTNGHGEQPESTVVDVDAAIDGDKLPVLKADGWVFDGWYTESGMKYTDTDRKITANTTLYAKWHEYKSADLTVTVANSEYLVNEPVEVNVVAALGDDSSKVAKVVLEYDDDVTSVKLGDIILDGKEFTSDDINKLLKQVGSKDDAKLTVTYSKPGKHTFSVALVDKDGKNVCEAGTDITVVQALMDTTVTEDGEQKETYPANKPITVKMNVTADKETFKQNTLYLTYGDEVEKVELNGHKLTEKQYKISDLLDMMETSPVAAYALRSEADALSIPFEVTFKDAGSYDFEMLVKDAQDQLVCRSIVPIKVEAEKKPDDTKDNTDTKPATYTLSILGGTVKVNGKETAVDEHGDIAIAKDAKVEVTFDKGILSDAQTFDQWIIKPNSVLNAVDPKSETIIFTMPDEKVTIEAMTKDASIEEEPNILGTTAVVGTAAVGTAILAWQGYQLGTELYLKTALPAGTAIPTNRAELALLVWNHAGKPAPAAVLPADATDTQKAIAWAVENDLLKAAKDNGETYVDTDSVSRVEVIRVWNKAQEK